MTFIKRLFDKLRKVKKSDNEKEIEKRIDKDTNKQNTGDLNAPTLVFHCKDKNSHAAVINNE